MRAGIAATVFVLACAAAPAGAQEFSSGIGFVAFGGVGRTTQQRQASVRISGAVSVAFRGDPAAGCQAAGSCGVSGTVTWNPGTKAALVVFETGRARHRTVGGVLFPDPSGGAAGATAVVRRLRADGSTATCADGGAAGEDLGLAPLVQGGHTAARIGLLAAGLTVETRCAGPLDRDLARVLPTVSVSLAHLAKGATIDLRGRWPFQAAGLSGTTTSSVFLRTGRLRRSPSQSPPPGLPLRTVRVVDRDVIARYSMQSVSGTLTISPAGASSPGCETVDSCGRTGTDVLELGGAHGDVFWEADSRSGADYRSLRRALGLSPGPRPRTLTFGSGQLTGRIPLAARLTTGDGGDDCIDSTSADGLTLRLARHRSRVRATLELSSLRSHCAGPLLSGTGASATVPLSSFAHPTVVLRLTGGRRLGDDGWTVRTAGTVDVVLRRNRVTQHTSIEREPRPG